MKQPESYIVHGQEHKVCKLVRSLYGLKQAPKQWHEKFDSVILSYDFKISESDNCLYYKLEKDKYIIFCLYVDDILILAHELETINQIKEFLFQKFDMKDLGEADVILGMKIIRSSNSIKLSQSHYTNIVLDKFGYSNCTPVSTPYDSTVALVKNNGQPINQEKYAQIIGSLMYLTTRTRPDISYAISRLSRYTNNPSTSH